MINSKQSNDDVTSVRMEAKINVNSPGTLITFMDKLLRVDLAPNKATNALSFYVNIKRMREK